MPGKPGGAFVGAACAKPPLEAARFRLHKHKIPWGDWQGGLLPARPLVAVHVGEPGEGDHRVTFAPGSFGTGADRRPQMQTGPSSAS